jgi:transposase
LYVGFDVHSSSSVVGVVVEDGRRLSTKKVHNDPQQVLEVLMPLAGEIVGVVVESTYNWYWIVDCLMDAGYKVHLANPSKIKQYEGLKHMDDRHDAFWLAELLRLQILPVGYIYPKHERPVRDLMRKRGHLVRLRTSLVLGLESIITRNYGIRPRGKDLLAITEDRVTPLIDGDEYICLAAGVSKETIDFLTGKIRAVERAVLGRVRLRAEYRNLTTLPGVGKILALTIMLETGPVSRFIAVGNYVSYCRKVPTVWLSDGKRKGKGNRKNGNKYLSWAFAEAAELARRFDGGARSYYSRKLQRTNAAVAHSALAHKLASAAYYIMRDGVVFMPERCFS